LKFESVGPKFKNWHKLMFDISEFIKYNWLIN
jgi:hypothetical protein